MAEGTFSRLMSQPPPAQAEPEAPPKAAPRRSTSQPKQARTDARVHARTQERVRPVNEESLYRKLQEKQRLASSTFRFRPEELEDLDRVFAELHQVRPGRVSKNDLVRL